MLAVGRFTPPVAADLAAEDGPHKLAAEARRIIGGRLDMLIANAGIAVNATIEETTVEDFDKFFAVNVRAVISRAAIAANS